jgi:D-alanine-D-alanine ligase
MSAKAFRALGCDGMARVDFFVRADLSAVVNEINTIPGFTDISMYAKALAASGIAYPEILDRLIAHGLARAQAQG